jgi:hypothetical protein
MLVSLALAALAYAGAKGNMRKALAIDKSMPTGMLPALAAEGGGNVGVWGAHTATAIGGPGVASPIAAGGMMMKAHDEGGREGALPTNERVPHERKPPANHAVEVVKKHKGSIREAIAELNLQGFTQAEMREALEAAWRSTGRDTAGVLTAQDGTLVLLSRRIGPHQPVNLIRPNGVAEFGTGDLFVDTTNLQSPIGLRNLRAGDGRFLLMPGEAAPASTVHPPGATETLARPPRMTEPTSLAERLEELSRDPDHSGKITEASRREAKVALDLESRGLLEAPVRRPVRGDGHSGDFLDGAGRDWDMKGYRSRQTIIDSIRARAAAKGRNPPKMDPGLPVEGEFELETSMQQLRKELRAGERLIIDTAGLTPEDLAQLKQAVKREKLDDQVLFHE